MKQKLLDFLGDYAETYCSRIEEDCDGIFVYGSGNFLSMSALTSLIVFANFYGFHYYVGTFCDEVRFRIYRS